MIVTQDLVNNSILSSPGDLAVAEGQRNGKFSLNGKLGHSCVRVIKGRLYDCPGQKSCYCAFRFKVIVH